MNSKTARICFYGNLKQIGDAKSDPEKYNLYFGLAKLAEAVSDVNREVQLLRQEIMALDQPMKDEGGNHMIEETLTDKMVDVMRLIKEKGASVCAGTCEHRKPGELHCLTAAQILKSSAAGYKQKVRKLAQMGLLERKRVQREDGAQLAQYTLTELGEHELSKRCT